MPEFDRTHLADLLRRNRVFQALGDEALQKIVDESTISQEKKGTVLWKQGDDVDQAAFVLNGRLDLVREARDGGEMVLQILGPGDIVALFPLDGENRTADLVVGRRSDLLFLSGATLRRAVRKQPRACYRILGSLGVVVGKETREREGFENQSSDERVTGTLHRLAGSGSSVEVTQVEIAEIVGTSREKVARILSELQRRGLIRRTRGHIEILRH